MHCGNDLLTNLYKRFLKFIENSPQNGRTINNSFLGTIGRNCLGTYNLSKNLFIHWSAYTKKFVQKLYKMYTKIIQNTKFVYVLYTKIVQIKILYDKECRKNVDRIPTYSLFLEEISACAAVHTRYVINACNRVRCIILLPRMMRCHLCLSHEKGWISVNPKTE